MAELATVRRRWNEQKSTRMNTTESGVSTEPHDYWAKVVDIVAVFATICGVAASLRVIGQQLMTDINYELDTNIGKRGENNG